MDLKNILKTIRLQESTISMVLGVIVVIVAGILAVNYLSSQRNSTLTQLEVGDKQETGELPTKHVVGDNESLWTIAEKYYGTGYNWIDIRDANNIANPNQISTGQELVIPSVTPRSPEEEVSPTVVVAMETGTTTATLTPTTQPEATATISVSPTPNPSVTPAPQISGTHVVEKGESLWTIATKYYGSGYEWNKIAKENNIGNPSEIEIGQSLVLPSATQTVAENETVKDEGAYTIQKGDSLWTIADKELGDPYRWSEIAKLNSLKTPSIIHTGNTLTLPTK
jgi:nucleoid-associated protein YgaU